MDGVNKAVEMLMAVSISNPKGRIKDYPHQLSGGMHQRAKIVIALCCTTPPCSSQTSPPQL
jgi:oligopeptide transport system ATP-binding protein